MLSGWVLWVAMLPTPVCIARWICQMQVMVSILLPREVYSLAVQVPCRQSPSTFRLVVIFAREYIMYMIQISCLCGCNLYAQFNIPGGLHSNLLLNWDVLDNDLYVPWLLQTVFLCFSWCEKNVNVSRASLLFDVTNALCSYVWSRKNKSQAKDLCVTIFRLDFRMI